MKHIYTCLAVGVISALSVSAQSKIDLQGRLMLKQLSSESLFQTETVTSGAQFNPNAKSVATQRIAPLSTIVVLNDGYTADDLESAGFNVTTRLQSVALVNVSSADVERMAELDCVRSISFGRKLETYLDQARLFSGVDQVHSGIEYGGQKHSFTGDGVCTGIYDIGIDANHISFYNPDGTTRVKQLQHYFVKEDGIYLDIYQDPTQFTTDSISETHGTHTAGIMAGGYQGLATYMKCRTEGGEWYGGLIEGANPFYGVATNSDILLSAGVLNDAASLDAFTRMASYAKDNGQPCVINYSVGTGIGPHDSSDPFSKAVSEIVDEYGAIIVMAAGNSGGTKSCVGKTFTATDKSLKTCITPDASYNPNGVFVILDIWADDATPFKLSFNSFKPRYMLGGTRDENVATIDSPDQSINYASKSGVGMTFNDVLKGHYAEALIIAESEIDPYSGRYHVIAQVYYYRADNFASLIYLNIESEAGKTVTANLSNAGEFTSQPNAVANTVEGDDSNTISDCACNPDVISVGSYNNKGYYGTVGGLVSHGLMDSEGYVENGYSSFSSYGKAVDGRQLPEVLAPGANVIAPFNTYYVNQGYQYQTSEYMTATAQIGDETQYWGGMTGTSMSAPFVAGVIALWLEADPTLTVNDIHQLIATTSTKDETLEGLDEKVGHGRINPVGGIQEILSRSLAGLGNVDADNVDQNMIIDQQQGSLTAFLAGENALTASLFTASGVKAAEAKSADSSVTVATDGLSAGIYVLRVEGASGLAATRKVVIR